MKTKKIIDLCKKAGCLILINEKRNNNQWVSDGYAIYPLLGLPIFSLEQLCLTYDIDEKKKDKMQLKVWDELPNSFDFRDNCEDTEEPVNGIDFGFAFEDSSALPLNTKDGISFMDKKYLTPLSDVRDNLRIFTRYDEIGRMYFVLKVGYMLYGIVTPMKNIINDRFIAELERLTVLCKEANNTQINIVDEIGE